MPSELIERAHLGRHATLTQTGLILPDGLEFEQWEEVGAKVVRMANTTVWAVADWAFYGHWARWGSRYEEALAQTGLDYGTLRNYVYVAGRFGLSRRRDNLSFAHHAAVAPLTESEQDAWLDRAERFGWSMHELRERIRRDRELDSGDDTPPAIEQLKLVASVERVERWRSAAERAGATMDDWAAAVLDVAAAEALGELG